ncbi:LysR family transcriptional regulator [Piscinibacter terrae]|uniref:LysR family transcriptional regulator n=1 Tax=Piscinibacter terrae TaxID=2496871 RepID=A0A3N7HQ85_9BURK|nr:LysR family transcriptional regulator [Albitalea terrae]RQP24360.1 LysR family transcriptional regulator [Albitalea terrae]
MRELNLDQLRTLVTVAELGSFTLAARALHLSQPAVSLHVSELEKRLDVALVVRGPRRVSPTPAGEELVQRARRLLREARDTVDSVKRRSLGIASHVRVGASTGGLSHVLPGLLRMLEAQFGDAQIELHTGRSIDLLQSLKAGDLDVAVVAGGLPVGEGISAQLWRSTPLLAVVPKAWKAPAHVTPRWLAARPFIVNEPTTHIYMQLMAWFAQAGLQPTPRLEMPYDEVTRGLISAGYGAAVMPLEAGSTPLPRDVRAVPLRPALKRTVVVCHRSDDADDALPTRVAQAIGRFDERT